MPLHSVHDQRADVPTCRRAEISLRKLVQTLGYRPNLELLLRCDVIYGRPKDLKLVLSNPWFYLGVPYFCQHFEFTLSTLYT
jgi:hypothetical protein